MMIMINTAKVIGNAPIGKPMKIQASGIEMIFKMSAYSHPSFLCGGLRTNQATIAITAPNAIPPTPRRGSHMSGNAIIIMRNTP